MQKTVANTANPLAEKTQWQTLAEDILKIAQAEGASQAEVGITSDTGFSVNVRLGEVETVEYNRDKGVGVTVYFGQCKGSASTSDTSLEAVKNTVIAACNIARFTSEDPYSGLADAKLMAHNYPDLDLYHPWAITPEQAIQLAKECEDQARAFDPRIVNSEGASVSTHQGIHIYANSYGANGGGFNGAYASSRHGLNCSLVAQDSNGMQRDGSYTIARDAANLETIATVAKHAGERTVKRLGSRRLKTCQTPVIFHAEIASGLIGCFLSAIAGSSLYRKSSFLVDHLGKTVFSDHVKIYERPHLLKGLGSAPFDSEGVATHDRDLVIDGVLQGYLLGSYSARKLGMQSTGNAGGAHNVLIKTSNHNLTDLLKQMHTGLLITELMGQGINIVTGDYSRGAVGFWVENGEIQYPVDEITIAGNLRDMFRQLVTVGNDIDHRRSILTGSILLENMMIAGE